MMLFVRRTALALIAMASTMPALRAEESPTPAFLSGLWVIRWQLPPCRPPFDGIRFISADEAELYTAKAKTRVKLRHEEYKQAGAEITLIFDDNNEYRLWFADGNKFSGGYGGMMLVAPAGLSGPEGWPGPDNRSGPVGWPGVAGRAGAAFHLDLMYKRLDPDFSATQSSPDAVLTMQPDGSSWVQQSRPRDYYPSLFVAPRRR